MKYAYRLIMIILMSALIASGLYLSFSQSWTGFHKSVILLHPAIGALAALFLLAGTLTHLSFHSVKKLPGFFLSHPLRGVLYCLTLLSFLPGVFLLLPSAPTSRFAIHRNLSLPFTALALAAAGMYFFKKSKTSFALFLAATTAVFLLSMRVMLSGNLPLRTFSVNLTDLLSAPPDTLGEEAAYLNTNRSCGGDNCHAGILKEHLKSMHFVSSKMKYIQNINAMMLKENPKAGGRWCSGCHFPQETFSGNFSFKDRQGMSCTFCHSTTSVRVESLVPPEEKGKIKKGYDVAVTKHAAFFPTDARSEKLPTRDAFLIRLNRLAHARAFRRPLYKKLEFCMPCHEGNIPPPEPEDVVRPNCVDCHMRSAPPLLKTENKKSHLFLGGNILIPTIFNDRKMFAVTLRWLTGNFSPTLQDSIWEIRKGAGDPPERATWIVVTLEPLSPPKPGKKSTVRIYTSNPGTGHPFPTGALHLFDIWMEFRAETQYGALIYKSGGRLKETKNYFKDGVHRLGGVMLDKDKKIIEGPLFWKKKDMQKRWVEWGKTIHDDFSFRIPGNPGNYIVVKAAWKYSRVNREFSPYVFGKAVDFPAITIASVTQKIPVEKQ